MKKSFYLLLLLSLLIGVQSEPLSPLENQRRLNECGKTMLPIPTYSGVFKNGVEVTIGPDEWIVRVANKEGITPSYDSTGTFISPRHIITSSQPILGENYIFHLDGKKFSPNDHCESNPEYVQVPDDYVQNMEITSGFCASSNNCPKFLKTEQFQPVKAWFLKYCAPERHQHKSIKMRVVMLIEVEEVAGRSFVCVSNTRVFVKPSEVHVYGIGFPDGFNTVGRMKYRRTADVKTDHEFRVTPKYYAPGDRGGPLIEIIHGLATLIGVGASPGLRDYWYETYFYRLPWYQTALCEAAGICSPTRLLRKSKATPTIEECVDLVSECDFDDTICDAIGAQEFVNIYCRKTCGLCATTTTAVPISPTPTAPCVYFPDLNTEDCKFWAGNGFCTSSHYSEASKREYCATTCQIC